MKIKNILSYAVIGLSVCSMSSCMKDLSRDPIDPTINTTLDVNGLYSKCYAGLIMEGNDGSADFSIDDAGKSTLTRNLFNFNCVSTDEAICWWSDGGMGEIGQNKFAAGNATLKNIYYRLMSNITYCNQFLGLDECKEDATKYAEVQFLRAYYYYQLTDMFGNVPFLDKITSEAATQKDRSNMFNWIESQLLEAEKNMLDAKPKTSVDDDYGRADKAAAWLLLSRLYLNAGVWLNDDGSVNQYWANAKDYAKKVIDAYPIFTGSATSTRLGEEHKYTAYDMLFMGDNGESGASVEAVLPLLQDGMKTRGWGGSLFFIAAMWDGNTRTVTGQDAGTTGNNWSGMRCRPELLEKFIGDPTKLEGKTAQEIRAFIGDDRALFYGVGHTVDLKDNTAFTQGIPTVKWNNNRSDGTDPHNSFDVDTDFFLLRSAEAYLNYVEAYMRENKIDNLTSGEAKIYYDAIRSRAHASAKNSVTLDDILDERAREFYFEGMRRPDLIRFGQFGGPQATYVWQYKGGGYPTGVAFGKYMNVYPLPTSELAANSNLKQNDGYK